MNEQDPPTIDQPTPGPAPQPEREPLLSIESLGPERVLCLEAIIAEHYGHFERRRLKDGDQSVWKWRQPRNMQVRHQADWVLRPPSLARDSAAISMMDILLAREGLDWMMAACVVQTEGENIRAYMMGVGRTSPNGAFVGASGLKCLVREMELGCMILLQKRSGLTIEGMHSQLFPHQVHALLGVVPSGPVS
jgi:hypothetical protein